MADAVLLRMVVIRALAHKSLDAPGAVTKGFDDLNVPDSVRLTHYHAACEAVRSIRERLAAEEKSAPRPGQMKLIE
jgi:hypothetical protein